MNFLREFHPAPEQKELYYRIKMCHRYEGSSNTLIIDYKNIFYRVSAIKIIRSQDVDSI